MNAIVDKPPQAQAASRFNCRLARSAEEVVESQQLRYRIFADEMGAAIDGGRDRLDQDRFDTYCHHLLVRETASGRLVASTRILTDAQARAVGGFYSEGEFDLRPVLALPGRKLEVGRTCVDPEYRNGATIATLWSGLGEFVTSRGFDMLFGCASIELNDGGARAHAIVRMLEQKHSAALPAAVTPHVPLPATDLALPQNPRLPPLLKAYLSLGAKSCGKPYWDAQFGTADVLVLLRVAETCSRYARHFMPELLRARMETQRAA